MKRIVSILFVCSAARAEFLKSFTYRAIAAIKAQEQ